MTPVNPVAKAPRGEHPGRKKTPVEELVFRAAALDAAVKALLTYSRATTNMSEAKAFRAVGRELLSQRNTLISRIIARGGHYYTGTRIKLELSIGD